jgi:hypothetical protein
MAADNANDLCSGDELVKLTRHKRSLIYLGLATLSGSYTSASYSNTNVHLEGVDMLSCTILPKSGIWQTSELQTLCHESNLTLWKDNPI